MVYPDSLYPHHQPIYRKPPTSFVSSLQDLSHYTAGLPVSNEPGSPNWFNIIRKILPGPYTLILPASKNLPSQMVDFMKVRAHPPAKTVLLCFTVNTLCFVPR